MSHLTIFLIPVALGSLFIFKPCLPPFLGWIILPKEYCSQKITQTGFLLLLFRPGIVAFEFIFLITSLLNTLMNVIYILNQEYFIYGRSRSKSCVLLINKFYGNIENQLMSADLHFRCIDHSSPNNTDFDDKYFKALCLFFSFIIFLCICIPFISCKANKITKILHWQ